MQTVLFTVVFPLPVTPITLNQWIGHLKRCAWNVGYVRDERRRIFGVFQDQVFGRRPALEIIRGTRGGTDARVALWCELSRFVPGFKPHIIRVRGRRGQGLCKSVAECGVPSKRLYLLTVYEQQSYS